MSETLVSVQNLTWQYIGMETPALKDINFELHAGEVLGITGPSGAGKTTLTIALNGLIPNNFRGEFSGDVIINGNNTRDTEVCDLVQEVGLVFQDPETQFMGLSVKEELIFALENLGLSDEEISVRIKRALEFVHMEDMLERSPFDLSGGQKQRVAIAAVLALNPSVLVLDEPTSELDPIGSTEVFSVLQKAKEQRELGIILVSHATEELAAYCDRVLLLSEGSQICLKKTQDFFCDISTQDEYGVQVPQIAELFAGSNQHFNGHFPITLEQAIKFLEK